MSDINKLKKARAFVRASIIKLLKKLETDIENIEYDTIEETVYLLETKSKDLVRLDCEIFDLLEAESEDFDSEILSVIDYEENIVLWTFRAEKCLRSANKRNHKSEFKEKIIEKYTDSSKVIPVKEQSESILLNTISINKSNTSFDLNINFEEKVIQEIEQFCEVENRKPDSNQEILHESKVEIHENIIEPSESLDVKNCQNVLRCGKVAIEKELLSIAIYRNVMKITETSYPELFNFAVDSFFLTFRWWISGCENCCLIDFDSAKTFKRAKNDIELFSKLVKDEIVFGHITKEKSDCTFIRKRLLMVGSSLSIVGDVNTIDF